MKKDTTALTKDEIWQKLQNIPDPEIPVISIVDLGIIRNVEVKGDDLYITMTPTYSGCPALIAMQDDVRAAFQDTGMNVHISITYKPAWTTDWMSEETKKKLEDYGIAPPVGTSSELKNPFRAVVRKINCPFCKSENTIVTSPFGSTACKSLHYCKNCNQPFEHFKCH